MADGAQRIIIPVSQTSARIRPHTKQPDAGIAFAVRALIHLASLFPEALDLRQVGRDVDQVVTLLGNGKRVVG
jgi:hypothetical protein